MFTNNFRKILFKVVFGLKTTTADYYPPTDSSSYSSLPRLTSITGASRDIDSSAIFQRGYASIINSLSTINTGATNGQGYIILGTGTTEPTADDYHLESQITENLSCDSVSVSRNTTIKTYTATFSNSGTSPITVTEIGYVSRILYLYDNGDSFYDNFLMDRTVLDTPITIPAGESRTVTYELSFKEVYMAELSTIFTNIANSIRNKAGITNTMLPSEMPTYIDNIEIPEPTKANMIITDQGGYVTLSSHITCSISETE